MSRLITRVMRRAAAPLLVALLVAGLGLSSACDRAEPDPPTSLDTRLETHAVLDGAASAEGLAYLRAVAAAHERADAADRAAAIELLVEALGLEPIAGDGTAELVHYELLARAAEAMLAAGDSERALELLRDRMTTETSLPVDRASARCLVALGDAAAQTGDLALAMGSYARALDMLTLLLEEIES